MYVLAEKSLVPVPIDSNEKFTHVTVDNEHSCAISTKQKLYCWGSSYYGENGSGSRCKLVLLVI